VKQCGLGGFPHVSRRLSRREQLLNPEGVDFLPALFPLRDGYDNLSPITKSFEITVTHHSFKYYSNSKHEETRLLVVKALLYYCESERNRVTENGATSKFNGILQANNGKKTFTDVSN